MYCHLAQEHLNALSQCLGDISEQLYSMTRIPVWWHYMHAFVLKKDPHLVPCYFIMHIFVLFDVFHLHSFEAFWLQINSYLISHQTFKLLS